jgi:LysR family transcriptional regulator, benzoate and cis,cis-muconate-responsive activator of ben and cat genes
MPAEPELRQLRTFVAVAEELHFTRAAARLNLAQQALSAQIRKLEERLGVELFERTTRHVELTDAGRTLLSHAMPLLASATRAWEEVSRAGAGEAGQISLTYAPTARREVLPAILSQVHRRYPRLEVKSAQVMWGRDAIRSRLAEVAIIRGPAPEEEEIVGAELVRSPLGVVLAAEHPLVGSETVEVTQLSSLGLEIPARQFSPGFHDVIVSALQGREFTGPVIEYENLGSRILFDDDAACARILAGETFGVSFADQYDALPPGFAWMPIVPELLIPLTICWRQDCGTSVANFVAVALDVADQLGWVARTG